MHPLLEIILSVETLKWPQTVPYTVDGTRRRHPRTPEDRFLPNTDGGQNRAKIGISGQNLASM
eukprot:2203304-Prymnesium_polylepis.1